VPGNRRDRLVRRDVSQSCGLHLLPGARGLRVPDPLRGKRRARLQSGLRAGSGVHLRSEHVGVPLRTVVIAMCA
jgi:hypothetical protein